MGRVQKGLGVTGKPYGDLTPRARRWMILWALLRPGLIVVSLLLLYYLLPLWDRRTPSTVFSLVLGMVLVAVLLVWQIRKIATAKYPRLRAIETLALVAPLFVLVFATVYFATGQSDRASFSEALSRTGSLYFTMTVFSSVGFGDIVPVTDTARVLVIFQMLGDLVLIGIVARAILGAVQSSLRRQDPATDSATDPATDSATDPATDSTTDPATDSATDPGTESD
jgi:voltage-gated potassium channel